ncbi:MAG TPA: hypothetical protein PLC84_05050 [Methanosarcina thermophila]|jgi:hypothetical protein|nr:hypothetical protein [Methanosarcina thermophila]HOA68092.1 hypothetical protein [Methanosarcina thermophila]HPT81511.1 hypothetical protein [Methanosarcina thermophila]HPZ19663.1 hypothetical protein [Methanosarcina thermophila]
MNKDYQAYSDFKEGVNKGLDIAKYAFEENLEKLSLSCSDEDRIERIRLLENDFNALLDAITLPKTPNCSEERLVGVQTGFEKSKKIFKEFIKESFPLENT